MSKEKLRILWVSTSHYPAPGGAPIYMKYLGELMDISHKVEKVTVLAEAYPGQPAISRTRNGKQEVHRIFPYRGGAEQKGFLAYFKYGLQNLHLLRVPFFAKKMRADIVVFHSWYFLNPSVLPLIVKSLKGQSVKLVADMRDAALPERKFSSLVPFDVMICCGHRVMEHFSTDRDLAPKRHYIPVPIECFPVDPASRDKVLEKYELRKDGYIFAPIGVSDQKRFPLLFESWQHLLKEGHHVDLVIAGKKRDWKKRYDTQTQGGRLILTGLLDRNDIHALYAGAALSMSPSNAESFGRVPAEAIQHGKPILFPSGIPEYRDIPQEFICDTDDPARLAGQISNALKRGKQGFDYDISQHSFETVCDKTLSVFSSLCGNSL